MTEFKTYKRRITSGELRPYKPGEDLNGISVQPGHEPKEGDMIARDPENHADEWLVSKQYFEQNYVPDPA